MVRALFIASWPAVRTGLVAPQLTAVERASSRPRTLLRCRLDATGVMAPGVPRLDQAQFGHSVTLYALRVQPRIGSSLRALLDPHLLRVPTVRAMFKENNSLVVLLRHMAVAHAVESPGPVAELPGNLNSDEPVRNKLEIVEQIGSALDNAAANGKQIPEQVNDWRAQLSEDDLVVHKMSLGFDIWSAENVLKRLLPPDVTVPTGFETVGHILHLNLRDEHEPYKQLIAEVLLAKYPNARTVVNKTDNTGGQFRVFPMEILYGEDNMIASVRENGCSFSLDYSKVYWNSRLETEHRRVVDSLKPNDCLADAFAGVGPFAVPAAKKKIRVYGNDLNPSSVEYMEMNAVANKVSPEMLTTSCCCAREFIRDLIGSNTHFSVVIMNFPSGAPEFLDMFIGAYVGKPHLELPEIHCYCFAEKENWQSSAIARVRSNLYQTDATNVQETSFTASVRNVRNVAPTKVQACVSFKLPVEVAYQQVRPHKRPRAV